MALYQESSPRFLHCAAQVGENCYLWGGHFSGKDQKSPTLSLQRFHPINGMWETKTTTGDAPFGLLDGACTTVSKSLYHFGGNDGDQFYNSLHCLECDTLQWSELHTSANRPMPKSGCGIVTYLEEALSAASLILFAGYGKPVSPTEPGARFIPDTRFSGWRGWTNEMHLFNLKKGMYYLVIFLCTPAVLVTHSVGEPGSMVSWRDVSTSSNTLPLAVWLHKTSILYHYYVLIELIHVCECINASGDWSVLGEIKFFSRQW